MEKQPKYITRVSLDFLRNDDSALEILGNIRRRLSRKTMVKARLADRIDDKFLSETAFLPKAMICSTTYGIMSLQHRQMMKCGLYCSFSWHPSTTHN